MAATESDDVIAKATRRMTLVTAVLGAFVGINTIVTGYLGIQAARDNAIGQRVANEEAYWIKASSELGDLAALRAEKADSPWALRHRFLRDRLLVHPRAFPADLGDYSREQRSAIASIEQLRKQVERSLGDPDLFGPRGEQARATLFRRDEIVRKAEAAGTLSQEQRQVVDAAAGAIVTRSDSIELTGLSKDGWDIDVFWCERAAGPAAQANFAAALGAGQALAAAARGGRAVDGEKLGRIRVRILPQRVQSPTGAPYPASGTEIRYDSADGAEEKLARALVRLPGLAGFIPQGQGKVRSRFYLSAFACGAPEAPRP